MADVTHPLTPREKVARAIQAHDNDHVPDGYANGLSDEVSDWSAYLADRVLTALASGSGDHAELIDVLRADRLPECSFDDGKTWELDGVGVAETFSRAADALEALLAKNAALRAERDALIAVDEAAEPLRQVQRDRAAEAERKLAEAVGLLEPFAKLADEEGGYREDDRLAWGLNAADINWGDFRAARTFLSKEAERG